jgi:hypothetical protein
MAKQNHKSKESIINYGKIKRDLLIRDTGLDSRFTTKVQTMKQHKKPKYKDWTDEE